MATPQELAKVKALVNTGVGAEDAARQVKLDSFGISPDFIQNQQLKRRARIYANETPEQKEQRNAWEVERISNMIAEKSVATRAFETPGSQLLSKLSPKSLETPKDFFATEKAKNIPTPITTPKWNVATSFNKEVDANIALGMNAQDAYNAAMAKKKSTQMTGATTPVTPTMPVDAINPASPTVQMQADMAKVTPPVTAPTTTQVIPEVTKTETPKFMTDVQRREQLGGVDKQASQDQMLANVNIMTKEDPNMMSDRAKFDAKTGYAGKPPEEKAILDAYFNSNIPKTKEEIKKQLDSWIEITDPKILKTKEYRQAKFEREKFSRYSWMTSEQLFNEMKTGLPTQVSERLRGTPAYQEAMAKYDNYKKVENINNTSTFLATGKGPEKDPLEELWKQLTAIFNQQDQTGSTAEAYRTFISQNPEITEPTAEYNTKMAQKKEFERAREALVEDLKKKYAGEPLSTILSIAARESKPINDQINTLNDSLATLSADIKFKTDLATQEFGFFTQDQQAKAAKQAKLQDLLGGLAVSQFGRQQDQAFEMKKIDIAQKFQQDSDVQKFLRELQAKGIQNVYDLEKMKYDNELKTEYQNIQNKFATSKSVQDFNNELFKAWIAPPTATAPTAPWAVQYTPGGTDFTGLAAKYPRVAAFKNNNPAGITWNANFDKGIGTAKALTEAGIQFEKGTERSAINPATGLPEGGNYVKFNSIEDGIAAQRVMLEKTYGNSTVGSMLSSWVGTKEWPAYAKQVAGMAGISTTDKVSDLTPEQLDMLQLAKIKKESPGLYDELSSAGIVDGNTINFSKASPLSFEQALASEWVAGEFAKSLQKGTVTGMTWQPKTLLATDRVLFDKFLSGKDTKEDQTELRRRGFTLDSVNEYASTIPVTEELSDKKFTQYNQILSKFSSNKEVAAFESGISSYTDLLSSLWSANWPWDIAAVFQFMKTLDPASTVRESEFELAAKSAGVWEQFKNIPINKIEGTVLTDEQRKAFGKLSLKFIENKAKIYDIKYADMERFLASQNIPSKFLPTKMSDYVKQYSAPTQSSTSKANEDYLKSLLQQ